MNIDFKIGSQLKAIRAAKNISQPALCEGICSINSLCRIEANTQAPSFELLLALVNRLGISMNTLVDSVNYEKNFAYYSLKKKMEAALARAQWTKVKELVRLVPDDVYDVLPVSEQQRVDIMRIQVAKFVDKDFVRAHNIAKLSLAKTFHMRDAEFYTPEELRLFNMLLQFDQSPEHLARVLNGLAWIEAQPEVLRDEYPRLSLLTGLTVYNYEAENWQEALKYARKGYTVAVENDVLKLIPNFLFGRGICLYLMKTDIAQGKDDMKAALQLCLQFDMRELHCMLLEDLDAHNIII